MLRPVPIGARCLCRLRRILVNMWTLCRIRGLWLLIFRLWGRETFRWEVVGRSLLLMLAEEGTRCVLEDNCSPLEDDYQGVGSHILKEGMCFAWEVDHVPGVVGSVVWGIVVLHGRVATLYG